MQSGGGVGDSAVVVIEGYEEAMAEKKKQRQDLIDGMPKCEHCGETMLTIPRWNGEDEKPTVRCGNKACPHVTEKMDIDFPGRPFMKRSGTW